MRCGGWVWSEAYTGRGLIADEAGSVESKRRAGQFVEEQLQSRVMDKRSIVRAREALLYTATVYGRHWRFRRDAM